MKTYLIFSMIPDQFGNPIREDDGEALLKKKHQHKTRHVHIAWSDGFIIDYREQGLLLGSLIKPGDDPYWFPCVEEDDDYPYTLIKIDELDKDELIDKAMNYVDDTGSLLTTLNGVLEAIKNQEEPNKEIRANELMTNATFIAWLLGKNKWWQYTTDRLYNEYGEIHIPGKITDFEYTGEA